MRRWLVLLVAVAGLVAAAAVEGVFSNRWGNSEDVRAAAAKLDRVPAAFGDWTSTELPQDPKVIHVAEAAGYVSRLYTNPKKRLSVSALMLCGPTGPIGAHTPEVCYAGNGFAMSGQPQKKTVVLPGNATATYWTARFEKKAAFEAPLRVGWMWGTDGDWVAASDPRTDFALRGALYKLYVVHSEPPSPGGSATASAAAAPDPIDVFLVDFLPEVKKALAGPPASPGAE
jgi:hypothetical protein